MLHLQSVVDGDEATTPLLFLHGVFMDRTIWRRVDEHLTGTRHAIDMPGHGNSPPMPTGATLADHVDAVRATAASAGVDLGRTVLVGHSWGGMVGLRLAAAGEVAGLVMVNAPVLATAGATRLGFQAQRLLLAAGFPAATYGRLAGRALIGADHRSDHPEAVDAMAERAHRMGRRTLGETLRAVLVEPDSAIDLLSAVEVPWSYVAGADDYVLEGGVREAVGAVGGLRIVPGGHASPIETPAGVVEAIEAVARSVVEAGTGRR